MTIQVPAAWYRGGTSKCWFFDRTAVDESHLDLTTLMTGAFGGTDIRQMDGVGGGTSTTSKAAIITPTTIADADLSYLFIQVGIGDGRIELGSNCGNCAAAIGLYAIQQGLVTPTGDLTSVRMFNENSHTMLIAQVATPAGRVPWEGTELIPGHTAPGVRVDLGFERPGGRTTGRLLPTGNPLDELTASDHTIIRATLIDAGAPACLIPALDLGLSACDSIQALSPSVDELVKWRRAAAGAMGLVGPGEPIPDAIPKVGIVGAAEDYLTTDGQQVRADEYDVAIRMLSMLAWHPAIGITSAVAAAAAALVSGSVLADLCPASAGRQMTLRLGTPVGVIETRVHLDENEEIMLVTTKRVARRIATALIDIPISHDTSCHHVQALPSQARKAVS